MNEIIKKLKIVEEQVISEKNQETSLFVLIKRTDLDGDKWDIILSSNWIEKNNLESDLVYIIDKLKLAFADQLDFLAQLVLLIPSSPLVKLLAKAAYEGKMTIGEEIKELKLLKNYTIKCLIPVTISLKHFDLSELNSFAQSLDNNENPIENVEEF